MKLLVLLLCLLSQTPESVQQAARTLRDDGKAVKNQAKLDGNTALEEWSRQAEYLGNAAVNATKNMVAFDPDPPPIDPPPIDPPPIDPPPIDPPPIDPPPITRLGINTAAVGYPTPMWVFANVTEQGVYKDGRFVCYVDIDGHFPQGKFTVVPSTAGTRTNTTNKLEVNLAQTPGKQWNFAIYVPGYGPGEPHAGKVFTDAYTEFLKPFSAVRFLDWLKTNDYPETTPPNWSDRTLIGDSRVHKQGLGDVPLERCVDLGNLTGKDIWLLTPHAASDEYVRSFAREVKARLKPNVKRVYVEYSNETWNSAFKQYGYLKAKADAAGLKLYEQYAIEAHADFLIWEEVFADEPERIVRVIAAQAGNPWHLEMAAKYMVARGWTCDAVAIAPYVGFSNRAKPGEPQSEADRLFGNGTTPQKVVAELFNKLPEQVSEWKQNKEWAALLGVPLIGYEGGQHLNLASGQSRSYSKDYYDAQFIPEMGAFYKALLDAWFEVTGPQSVLFLYNTGTQYTDSGYWGLVPYQDITTPKYKTVSEYP